MVFARERKCAESRDKFGRKSLVDGESNVSRMHSFILLLVALVTFKPDLVTGQEFETTHGRVGGMRATVMGKSLDVFHGIPFAKPPVGDLRFKHPQPADSWRPAVKNTTMETPACMQSTTLNDQLSAGDPMRLPGALSEDCLYLSIWKPTAASLGSNKPVMVWIYGGAFTYGSTSQPVYNGQYLVAENDVIVVSINYRIGPLGFSYLGPGTIPGNMGLMDQLQGLKWVKDNIVNFGGDINRITIFGESAGSYSVGYHLLSPLSRGLFNNAILQSGAPVSSVLPELLTPVTVAKNNVRKVLDLLKCPRLPHSDANMYQCMKNADSQAIITASEQLLLAGIYFYPVVDGYFLEDDPLNVTKREEHQKVNILIGVTKDEITGFFAFYFNPADMVVYTTGQKFGEEDFVPAMGVITQIKDSNERVKAMKRFYESEQNVPVDYLTILNYAGSDTFFKCPALQFSSIYTVSNDVYLYQLNYALSLIPAPEWMGITHAADIGFVFGFPVDPAFPFSDQDRELSRNVMKYWTNFAKTGNPNSPVPVTANWPVFNKENQTYMALDAGSNLATRHGFRRHQCAFVNDILPMIPMDEDTHKPVTYPPDITWPSGSGPCTGSVYVILSLLTASLWMLL